MRAPITDKHLLKMMWDRFPEIMRQGVDQPAQPAREWVGLTDEERNVINRHNVYVFEIIGATEAKLKEKNT